MAKPAKVFTLHRYFIVADQMRRLFDEYLGAHPGVTVDSDDWVEFFVYMSLWYGTLYVVVDGWRQLRLADTEVDRHLANASMVQLLEETRNGAFHYKSKYWDDTVIAMPSGLFDSARWVRGLHDALSSYFLSQYQD